MKHGFMSIVKVCINNLPSSIFVSDMLMTGGEEVTQSSYSSGTQLAKC